MRLTILAFDQSKSHTGYAIYIAPGEPSLIVAGSFSCIESGHDPATVFARAVKELGRLYKPDFFAWERAKPSISNYYTKATNDLGGERPGGWTVNAGQLILPELQGIIRGMAIAYGKPFAHALPATWRAAVFGKGGGALTTKAAKAEAKRHCVRCHIKADNEHEAEAACVALWAASTPEFRQAMDDARARAAA